MALVLEYLCVLSHLCAFAHVPLASMCSSTSFLSMKTLLLQSTSKLLPVPQFLDKKTCSITTLFIPHTLTVWTPVSRLGGSGRQDWSLTYVINSDPSLGLAQRMCSNEALKCFGLNVLRPLKNHWGSPKSFHLYGLYVLVFIQLEIKIEKNVKHKNTWVYIPCKPSEYWHLPWHVMQPLGNTALTWEGQ